MISIFYEKEGGITTFRSKFLSHGTEKFCWGNNSMYEKISSIEKNFFCMRRGYRDFVSKIFCFTVPKNFVEKPFCAVFQKISGSEKICG